MPATPTPYDPSAYVPPPPELPTLTVTRKQDTYRAFLRPELVERLGLRGEQPANLLPPTYGSTFWHLDLRPTAPRRIKHYLGQSPRIEGIRLPPGLVLNGQALTLCLLPGDPHYPHVYPLLPENAHTS